LSFKPHEPALAVLRWMQRMPLVPAFAISVLGHVLLLGAIHTDRAGVSPRSPIIVTLGRSVVSDERRPLPAEPSAHARLALPDPAAPAMAQPKASPAPLPVPVQPSSPARRANREIEFYPAESLGELPRALVLPELSSELGRQLAGRRLLVELRIDPFGAVSHSAVLTGEVNPEAIVEINRAIANATFVAGRREGESVGAIVRMRICFDLSGEMDTSSEECWGSSLAR
jgi:hypothetical protein